MIYCMDKNIYELLGSKVYKYVQDYVFASLTDNIRDDYEAVQSYLQSYNSGFIDDNIKQVLHALNVTEIKIAFRATLTQIPDSLLNLYKDLLLCLKKAYKTDLAKEILLDDETTNLFRYSIIDIIEKNASSFYKELEELNIIIENLKILMSNFSEPLNSSSTTDNKSMDGLAVKYIDTCENLINKYHVMVNTYFNKIYPMQVEAIYIEVMNSLINNILEFLSTLSNKGINISNAYSILDNYFTYLIKNKQF